MAHPRMGSTGRRPFLSFQFQKLHVKDKSGIRQDDAWVPSWHCRHSLWRQLGSLTHTHLGDPFFPASDHLLLAQHIFKGLASVPGGVKFLSIFKHPCVVHHGGLAVLWEDVPISRGDGLHLHSHGCCCGGSSNGSGGLAGGVMGSMERQSSPFLK